MRKFLTKKLIIFLILALGELFFAMLMAHYKYAGIFNVNLRLRSRKMYPEVLYFPISRNRPVLVDSFSQNMVTHCYLHEEIAQQHRQRANFFVKIWLNLNNVPVSFDFCQIRPVKSQLCLHTLSRKMGHQVILLTQYLLVCRCSSKFLVSLKMPLSLIIFKQDAKGITTKTLQSEEYDRQLHKIWIVQMDCLHFNHQACSFGSSALQVLPIGPYLMFPTDMQAFGQSRLKSSGFPDYFEQGPFTTPGMLGSAFSGKVPSIHYIFKRPYLQMIILPITSASNRMSHLIIKYQFETYRRKQIYILVCAQYSSIFACNITFSLYSYSIDAQVGTSTLVLPSFSCVKYNEQHDKLPRRNRHCCAKSQIYYLGENSVIILKTHKSSKTTLSYLPLIRILSIMPSKQLWALFSQLMLRIASIIDKQVSYNRYQWLIIFDLEQNDHLDTCSSIFSESNNICCETCANICFQSANHQNSQTSSKHSKFLVYFSSNCIFMQLYTLSSLRIQQTLHDSLPFLQLCPIPVKIDKTKEAVKMLEQAVVIQSKQERQQQSTYKKYDNMTIQHNILHSILNRYLII